MRITVTDDMRVLMLMQKTIKYTTAERVSGIIFAQIVKENPDGVDFHIHTYKGVDYCTKHKLWKDTVMKKISDDELLGIDGEVYLLFFDNLYEKEVDPNKTMILKIF